MYTYIIHMQDYSSSRTLGVPVLAASLQPVSSRAADAEARSRAEINHPGAARHVWDVRRSGARGRESVLVGRRTGAAVQGGSSAKPTRTSPDV